MQNTRTQDLKPPQSNLLRWAGSKASTLKQISPYLDFSRDYFEPFCGSAAMHFKFKPKNSFLNDANSRLISFYRHVATNTEEVWAWYYDQKISEANYYSIRKKFNKTSSGIAQAAMFLYLNHYGFNGIYRTNQKGELNTPFGAKLKQKRKLELDELCWFASQIQIDKLMSMDFEDSVRKIDPKGMCIYFDPPYFTTQTRVFSEYGKTVFSQNDLLRLRDLVFDFASNNLIAISYKDCSEFRELFAPFIVSTHSVARNVGGFANRRKRDLEVLAIIGN